MRDVQDILAGVQRCGVCGVGKITRIVRCFRWDQSLQAVGPFEEMGRGVPEPTQPGDMWQVFWTCSNGDCLLGEHRLAETGFFPSPVAGYPDWAEAASVLEVYNQKNPPSIAGAYYWRGSIMPTA